MEMVDNLTSRWTFVREQRRSFRRTFETGGQFFQGVPREDIAYIDKNTVYFKGNIIGIIKDDCSIQLLPVDLPYKDFSLYADVIQAIVEMLDTKYIQQNIFGEKKNGL